MLRTLAGSTLTDYLSKTFVAGAIKRITFKYLRKSDLMIKLNKYNNENYLNFSDLYHNVVIPKFEMDLFDSYYIYTKDLDIFNQMSAEEQLEYLKTVYYEDICIGRIDQKKFSNILFSLIKLKQEYSVLVSASEITGFNWYNINIDDATEISIFDRPLLKATNICAEVDINTENRKPSFYKQVCNLINSFNESNIIKITNTSKTQSKDYHTRLNINARIDDQYKQLIVCVFVTNTTQYGNSQLARIILNNQYLESIGIKAPDINEFIKTYDRFIKKLTEICELFRDNKILFKVGDTLLECIDNFKE